MMHIPPMLVWQGCLRMIVVPLCLGTPVNPLTTISPSTERPLPQTTLITQEWMIALGLGM